MKRKVISAVKTLLQFAVLMAFALFLCQNISAQESDLIMYESTETYSETQAATASESQQSSPQTGDNSSIIVPLIAVICAASIGSSAALINGKRKN